MSRFMKKTALILGLLAAGATASADAPVSSELLAFQCAGCHGFNGHSVGPATPSIAGFPQEYFVDTMVSYKEGRRYATIMDRITWGYTAEEIEAMADFFAAQPYLPAKQDFDPERAARGQAIHAQQCESCHSEGGTVAEPDTAPIAGQWMPYLRDAFVDFREHGRAQPRGMERRLTALDEDDLEALVHYYGSQQDPAAYAH
jgi:cytochrome subunit of sulfide dehydrogenase